MHNQLPLFPRPPRLPPRRRDPIFFALMLGTELGAHLPGLTEWLRCELKVDRPLHALERLHISVMGAGYRDDMTDEEVEAVCAAGPMVDFVPFDLAFTEIMSLGGRGDSGRSPLVLLPEAGSALVIDLAERLTEAMIGQGFDPRAFQPKLPHLTLLYESKRIDKTPLPTPIRVRVDGFALIQSHRGETRYTRLWPDPELLDG